MDSIKKRCLACGWPANNGDRYCCKCGGNSFDRDDDYIPSYSLFGFPPCECLSNGRTIKYKPSYRDASEITLKIKNICQVFDSYIIYAAEKIVGEHHSDIEIAELYIKGKDHRSSDGSRIASKHIVDGILEQSFFDFIAQDSGFPLRQIFEYYNDEYGLSENCIRANNTLYYVLTKPFSNDDSHSFKSSIGKTTLPLDSEIGKHDKRCGWCGWLAREGETICCKCGHTLSKTDFPNSNQHVTSDINPRAIVYGPPMQRDDDMEALRSTVYGPPAFNSRNRSYRIFGCRIHIGYACIFIILLVLFVFGIIYLHW